MNTDDKSQTENVRPWFKKKRYIIPITFFAATSIFGSFIDAETTDETVPTSQERQESDKPKEIEREYPLELIDYVVINPATIEFRFNVTNDGTQPVTPNCTIRVQDPSGTYRGFDIFTPTSPINPGVTQLLTGQLTVTKEGAAWANEWSGNCVATTTDTGSAKSQEIKIFDIVNCTDFDSAEGEWFWGSCFKADVSPRAKLRCEVEGLNNSGEIIATQRYQAVVGNNQAVMPIGDYVFPSTTKSIANAISDFNIECTY